MVTGEVSYVGKRKDSLVSGDCLNLRGDVCLGHIFKRHLLGRLPYGEC